MHCHHEKTIVIDDRVAFVGGIDLTSESGDRFDTNHHPARASVGWHDASARIEGPAVADVAEHFRMRWHEVHGRAARRGRRRPSAGGRCRAADRAHRSRAHLRRRSARRLPHPRVVRAGAPACASGSSTSRTSSSGRPRSRRLREKLADPPTPDFRLLLVLPAKPNSGDDDTRGVLAELIDADGGTGRILACTLYARAGRRRRPDLRPRQGRDRRRRLADPRLGEPERALALQRHRDEHRRPRRPSSPVQTRLRLWAEHLELPLDQIPADPIEAIDELWKPISKEQLERRSRPSAHASARPAAERLAANPAHPRPARQHRRGRLVQRDPMFLRAGPGSSAAGRPLRPARSPSRAGRERGSARSPRECGRSVRGRPEPREHAPAAEEARARARSTTLPRFTTAARARAAASERAELEPVHDPAGDADVDDDSDPHPDRNPAPRGGCVLNKTSAA